MNKESTMDPQRIEIAEGCLNGAFDKSMTFPQIISTLIEAGFEGYVVDYRRSITTYFLPDGDYVVLDNHLSEGSVAAQFQPASVANQVKWAQANPPDYSYVTFCERT
jgi:hypothetical protein